MQIHPDAETFPLMPEAELDELALDIAAHGLRETIKTDPAGELLVDGRNRERACAMAGVEPRYEPLPGGTDIFAYVISVNLHRRHLTGEQRHDIIRQVTARNPTLSNRQIAKLAHVTDKTVAAAIRSGAEPSAPEHKTTGADGKSYPASGQISPETRSAIIADLKANPLAQRDVALKHGVSIGTVSGIKSRLKQAGELVAIMPIPSLADQLAKRTGLPRFDTLTREERGMGTREEGARQHPDYPPGWTYDDVHRENYGRIQAHRPSEIEERKLVRRFTDMVAHLAHLVEDDAPSVDDLDELNDPRSREPIVFQIRKLSPRAIDKLTCFLQKLTTRSDDQTRTG